MEYLKVEWKHNYHDEPILIYSEIDDRRNELRKVEIYRDGRIGYADKNDEYLDAGLSEKPLPTLEEIAYDKQFKPELIYKEDFEMVWLNRTKK